MALQALTRDVERFTRKLGIQSDLAFLDAAWEREMGAWGGMAKLAALDHQTLVIEVQSSAAMQEINLRRNELVRRLNTHFPAPWIRGLSVKMAQYGDGR